MGSSGEAVRWILAVLFSFVVGASAPESLPCDPRSPSKCRGNDLKDGTVNFLSRNRLSDRLRGNSFLEFEIEQTVFQKNLLIAAFSLRIRTFQENSILLYGHDELRNFAQLEIRRGRLFFKYNIGASVFVLSRDNFVVNDGHWHAVKVDYRRIVFDNVTALNSDPRYFLPQNEYSKNNKLRPNEDVRVLSVTKTRYSSTGDPLNSLKIYVGALPSEMGSFEPFVGCLSDLNFGGHQLNLSSAVYSNSQRFSFGCTSSCSSDSCQEGKCLERWNESFDCNCWKSNFVGKRCNQSVSRSFSGAGGITLEFPVVRFVSVIGGKFALMAAPRQGDLLLHIDGSDTDITLFSERGIGAAYAISLLVQPRSKTGSAARVTVSLAGLHPPFVVRFWLRRPEHHIKLQLNGQRSALERWTSASGGLAARRFHVGDATSINQRLRSIGQITSYKHFKGCFYNFQIFVDETDSPIELSDFAVSRFLKFSQSSSPKADDSCPPFIMTDPNQEMKNMTDADVGKTGRSSSELLKWEWYKIVIGICSGMVVCLLILAIIFFVHSCAKRSRRSKKTRGFYTQISYTNTNSVDYTNGSNKRIVNSSPPASMASTQITPSPVKTLFRPPYVATSIILREGKHMANIDSDADLDNSESELP